MPERTFRTQSGTYSESDLAVVVWKNPQKSKNPRSRPLETMTSDDSPSPMAFPLQLLTSSKVWVNAKIAKSPDDVVFLVSTSDRSHPVVVPLPVAMQVFGWSDFYIPSEYTERV